LGVLAAMVTAAAVFGLGMLVLPSVEPPPAPPVDLNALKVDVPPVPPPPPPPPPAPEPPVDAAPDLPAPDAPPEAAPAARTAPAPAPTPPVAERAEPAPAPKPDPELEPKPAASAPHEKLADKEVARESWRRNLPDIAVDPGKAAMLIPIKGSIDGSTYHVTAKPRSVLVTLPKGESMITMPFYSVRHDGFRQLWIKKDDAGVTTIRVVLGDASDPQVEIKDEFVRVTVRRLTEAPAAAAAPAGAAPAATPTPAAPTPATKPTPVPTPTTAPAPMPTTGPAPTPAPAPAPATAPAAPAHD
jgi:hypothetical protein